MVAVLNRYIWRARGEMMTSILISEWRRLPGLFRKFEFAQIVEDDDAISFQKQGKAEDGTQLWALYRHCPETSR